ncbi:hypothetical protein [Saccharothrix obliqua]|uniref:hypothetical protein n=1 Tax=Saccharothrix obliqua TaxID=2861747 RepID=UPI001C5E3B4F|nr:hypothetical protein [Saccharothrix obliqua]MBW4721572.1 hypothetical protein [Saccharothrix obliqua]
MAKPKAVSLGAPLDKNADQDRSRDVDQRRRVHAGELVLFLLMLGGVVLLVNFTAGSVWSAVVLVLVLVFGTMLASRAEPATLGRWLKRLLGGNSAGPGA